MIGTLYISHSTTPGQATFKSVPYHSASIDWKQDSASTMTFSSPVEFSEADRVRYQSKTGNFGGQIYKKKKKAGSDYQYDVISYTRLYHDKVTCSYKNMTSQKILKKVLKLSKNNFRTSGIGKTDIIHSSLKWENKAIYEIALQLAWLEQQAGKTVDLYVDAIGTLIFKYATDKDVGYSFNSVLDYEEDYDSSDLITASRITYNGKEIANKEASKNIIAKWGYITEIEECQSQSSGTSTTTETTSGKLKDDVQIKKYKIPNNVVQQALKIAKEGNTQQANLKLLYNWCNKNIGYKGYGSSRYHASGTLKHRRGNCCDNANLLIAMARSVGIKARYVHATRSAGKPYGHVWGEYYINNHWFTVDTGTSSTTKYWGSHSNYATGGQRRHDVLPF